MITKVIWASMVMTAYSASKSANPVKLAAIMLGVCSISFYTLFWQSAYKILAILYYMLFMGGILVVFMILASLLPNEKSRKSKSSYSTVIAMTMVFLFASTSAMDSNELMKPTFTSVHTITGLLALIMMYFLSFIALLESPGHSMRFYVCCKTEGVVSL